MSEADRTGMLEMPRA